MKGKKHSTAGQPRWEIFGKQFVTPVVDWQEELLRMLLEAGANGVTQSTLTTRVYGLGIRSSQVIHFLESYRVQHGVQRFTLGKETTWRATTQLRSLL